MDYHSVVSHLAKNCNEELLDTLLINKPILFLVFYENCEEKQVQWITKLCVVSGKRVLFLWVHNGYIQFYDRVRRTKEKKKVRRIKQKKKKKKKKGTKKRKKKDPIVPNILIFF